jgi:hypothetical protein
LIVAGCTIGHSVEAQTPKPQSAPAKLAAENRHEGRYQIFFSPLARADVYLLDTETGKIWRPVTITNAKDSNLAGAAPEIWIYQERVDTETEFSAWQAAHLPTISQPVPATPK